jgi:hypothetical protein
MKVFSKILYYSSLCFIVICGSLALLLKILPLEFKNADYQEKFDGLFYFGIPIAILFTGARLGFKSKYQAKISSEILKTVLLSIAVFVLFILYAIGNFGNSMCIKVTEETLFIKKNSNSIKIVRRNFGCGATDSSPGTITIEKEVQVISFFVYYSPIDTAKINKSEWTPEKQ